MREGLGVDPAVRLLLDSVIADRGGGGQALLQVAVLEDAPVVGGPAPDAGQAVRLELETHREIVGVVGILLALLADLPLDPELLLDVVADLVGEDVGLGEVAGRLEALVELVEEPEVDVDLLVERAVERAGRRARRSTARVRLAPEEHELGLPVGLARSGELLVPETLGVIEHEGDELNLLLLAGASGDRGITRSGLRDLRERAARPRHVEAAAPSSVDDEEVEDDRDDHADDSAAAHPAHRDRQAATAEASAQAAALAPPVLEIPAALAGLPLHRRPLYPRPRWARLPPNAGRDGRRWNERSKDAERYRGAVSDGSGDRRLARRAVRAGTRAERGSGRTGSQSV